MAVALDPPRHRRVLRWVLALGLAGLLGYVAVALISGFADGASAIADADPGWLLVAVAVEAVAYVLLTAQLRRLIGPDVKLGRRSAMRLAMILCGFGCVTPASPAEGMVITGAELHRRGMPVRRVTVTLGMAEFISALAMVGVAAVNVLYAATQSHLPSGDAVPLIVAALVLLVGMASINLFARRPATAERLSVVLGGLCCWRPRPSVEARRAAGAAWHAEANVVLGSRRNRVLLLALSAAAWLADVVCLYVALASVGIALPFDVVCLAYTVGVLAYRCVSTLLPAAVGMACIPGLAARRRVAGAPIPLPATT